MLDNVGPRGMGGGFSPDILIFDEAHHCRPIIEDAYKVAHDIPVDVWSYPTRHGAETPRGTKPSFIGGKKKTKQQRAATKARRKQR